MAGFVSRDLRQPTTRLVGLASIGRVARWRRRSADPARFIASMPYLFRGGLYVPLQALVQQRTPPEMGGRMMSLCTL
jgi:hypothetical protein